MVELKSFSKKYSSHSENFAVKDFSLVCESAKITGILGLNGAGKTTILKAICAQHFATEGQVLVDLLDASEFPQKIRNLTGFVQEEPDLKPNFTVIEYIKMSAMLHNCPLENVEKVIKECSLEEVKFKKIKTLSKGFRERVNFAQALVYNPPVLVLDEPASGLDPNQIINMRALVKELAKEKTIILSTHLMQEAESLCDTICIIFNGQKKIHGTISQILSETGTKSLEEAFMSLVSQKESRGKYEPSAL